jgi:hypothetical protein
MLVTRWGTEETTDMASKLGWLFVYNKRSIALRVLRKFYDGVFEDSFWDILLQGFQRSGAVFPQLFVCEHLLASKSNKGSLHLCSHKYRVTS